MCLSLNKHITREGDDLDVIKLYPQYNIISERRQKFAPVSPVSPSGVERRSGMDRRNDDRVKLDTNLTKDIFEIKSKVAQIQKHQSNSLEKITFSQNITKATQHSLKTDQFIKSTKPTLTESPKELAKSKSEVGALAGLAGVVLGGTLASAFLGVAGVGIAIGLGAYLGAKFLRSAIVSHMKNK